MISAKRLRLISHDASSPRHRRHATRRQAQRWSRVRTGAVLLMVVLCTVLLVISIMNWQAAPPMVSTAVRSVVVPITSGMRAPDIQLPTALGGTFQLAEHQGHVVVLAFVMTQPDTDSNNPSLSQVVSLESMSRQYGSKGVQVVLIDESALVTKTAVPVGALLNASYDWHLGGIPLLNDSTGVGVQRYGVARLPTTFVISPAGQVIQRFDGQVLSPTMATTLQTLVGAPAQ